MNTFCEYYDQSTCKSCKLLAMPYPDQLKQKELLIQQALKISVKELLPTIPSPVQGFRNKVKIAVGIIDGKITFGLKDLEGKSQDLSHCPVQHPEINKMFPAIAEFIQTATLSVYDPKTMKGELKNLIIYFNPESNESYLRFVLRSKEATTRIQKNLNSLQGAIPHLTVISVNIQPSPHPLLEGNEEIVLTKRTHLRQQIGFIKYFLSTQGFVQTNLKVSQELYQTAAAWVRELKSKRFLELFSGQGAFSFFVAPDVDEARGFEINESAALSANQSASVLKLDHLKFKCLDAKDIASELVQFQPDVLLANPPRRGLGESLQLINQSGVSYFIYSSCNYETLASDIEALTNYEVERAQVFDMFAHTEHFETLVLLKKTIVELS